MWNWALLPAAFDTETWQTQKGTCKRQSSNSTSLRGERKCHTYVLALHDTFNLPTRPHLRVVLPLQTRSEPPPAEAPCLSNSRLVLHPSFATNEPASTLSKSSDDTDGGGAEEGGCWRLIFTLDSPSSPLDCRVYLPTQLASAEDRQTDRQWASARGDGEGGSGGVLSADCLWRWASSLSGCLQGAPPPRSLPPRGPLAAHWRRGRHLMLLFLCDCCWPEITDAELAAIKNNAYFNSSPATFASDPLQKSLSLVVVVQLQFSFVCLWQCFSFCFSVFIS